MKRSRESERITTACTACRATKTRCDGHRPICGRCYRKGSYDCHWPSADGRSRRSLTATHEQPAPSLADLASAADQARPTPGAHSGSVPPKPHVQTQTPAALDLDAGRFSHSLGTIDSLTFSDVDWSLLAGNELWDPDEAVTATATALSAAVDATPQPPRFHSTEASSSTLPERLKVSYFRRLGPTGISPGCKKITMEITLSEQAKQALTKANGDVQALEMYLNRDALPHHTTTSPILSTHSPGEPEDDAHQLFEGDLPVQWVLNELLPIFAERLGDQYLCLNTSRLRQQLEKPRGAFTGPPLLINAICALAARYSSNPVLNSGAAASAGEPFAEKAKTFLAASLTVPSKSSTLAFLMLAWCEFAANLDSAFWNYVGLAVRMAIDLGLHSTMLTAGDEGLAAEDDIVDGQVLFWTIYQMDRILAMGTGRPVALADEEITVAMPSMQSLESQLFAVHIQHVKIGGKILQALNSVSQQSQHIAKSLDALQGELIDLYDNLPDSMRLTANNFIMCKDKHLFLEMHLWVQCMLLTLNRPAIAQMRCAEPAERSQLVRAAIGKCHQAVTLDEAHDRQYLICAPMTNTAIFLAGAAELEEMRLLRDRNNDNQPVSRFVLSQHTESFQAFSSALDTIARYWDGVRWISGVLTQRESGITDEDLTELTLGTDAVLSKREMRLLQRLHAGKS